MDYAKFIVNISKYKVIDLYIFLASPPITPKAKHPILLTPTLLGDKVMIVIIIVWVTLPLELIFEIELDLLNYKLVS